MFCYFCHITGRIVGRVSPGKDRWFGHHDPEDLSRVYSSKEMGSFEEFPSDYLDLLETLEGSCKHCGAQTTSQRGMGRHCLTALPEIHSGKSPKIQPGWPGFHSITLNLMRCTRVAKLRVKKKNRRRNRRRTRGACIVAMNWEEAIFQTMMYTNGSLEGSSPSRVFLTFWMSVLGPELFSFCTATDGSKAQIDWKKREMEEERTKKLFTSMNFS